MEIGTWDLLGGAAWLIEFRMSGDQSTANPVYTGHGGQGKFEGVGAVAAVALGLQGDIQLVSEREARQ